MAISVTITLSSAGTDTGPNFTLFCPTGTVTPFTASKSELLLGKTVVISDDNASQVHVISNGSCTNTLVIGIPQLITTSTTTTTTTLVTTTTSTTTTTTTLVPTTTSTTTTSTTLEEYVFNINGQQGGSGIEAYVSLTSGNNTPYSIFFDIEVTKHSDFTCNTQISQCTFTGINILQGTSAPFNTTGSGICSDSGVQSLKVTAATFTIDGNPYNITTSPQTITYDGKN